MRHALTSLLMFFCATAFAQGFGAGTNGTLGGNAEPEFLPVTEAYQLEVEVLDEQRLRFYWTIADAYYLYQHRFKFALRDASGEIELTPVLPPAKAKEDEFFGEVKVYYHDADIEATLSRPASNAALTVTSQGCADAGLCYPPHKEYFRVNVLSGEVTPSDREAIAALETPADFLVSTAPESADTGSGNLLYMLLLAFLGGAILNLMPCVFPILSLKVLSFANSTDDDRHLQSWVYTAGVIVSFVAVAAVLIALQQAGNAIGWGFQLQSPGFVIALAYLFIAMGLSLSGVVEFGGNLMNTGSSLANRGGLSGSFFTGVLAVVVASPCTAPFMGTALGFAVSQPPHIGLLVFAALGAGMAAPLLLFSYSGAARTMMPKPGAWMETLKEFLAFPLYATALWLLWVAGRQTGINTMTVALCGALMLAFGLWLWDQRRWRRVMALASIAAAIALGSMSGLDSESAQADAAVASHGKQPWSDAEVASLREAGQPVFVDVTADWCITCKANENAVLFTADVEQAFADHGVAYLVADWTNHDPDIAALLKRYQRNGIPLYLMYPADPAAQPLILPQLLTKGTVIEALEAVSNKNADVAGLL
jgi:thiol:disulfide interchange protein DsbD